MKNTFYIEARIYFDTNKTDLTKAEKDFWDYVYSIDDRMDIIIDECELRDSETGDVVDKQEG